MLVWPLAIDRFLKSPFVGVGASHVATWIPQAGVSVTPHNSFLLIALASGVLPLLFFIAYWVRMGVEAWRVHAHSHEDAVFLIPLFLYVFLIALELNGPYMSSWAMATFGTLGATGFLLKARRTVAGRMGRV
jgi:O-antigen ligase